MGILRQVRFFATANDTACVVSRSRGNGGRVAHLVCGLGQREGGPVERAEGEGQDGEGEKEDEIVDDELDERGRDEEDAERAEEDRAAVALKPGGSWGLWGEYEVG